MTDKKNNTGVENSGDWNSGYRNSGKEAWTNFWKDTDEENRKKFLALPNFDSEIFKDITGIDVEATKEPSLSGKEVSVTIDGKTYTAVIK